MESEHTAKTLQIALGSYDRKELRVEKNYLQEQSPALECTCFQNGGRLLEQLRQGRQFDVVILCSQLEDMSGLEFLMNIRSMDPKPNVVLFDEAGGRIRVPFVWNRAMGSAMWPCRTEEPAVGAVPPAGTAEPAHGTQVSGTV